MGKIISQIILGFIFITFLVILSFYTFFSGDIKELDKPNFNIAKMGDTSLDGVISDKINFYTTVYSINKDYKISNNTISFGTGIYLVDSKDIFSMVTLDMGENKVFLKGGGMVYINNNKDYKVISSFNNKVKVDFSNSKNDNKGIKVYLYPHMYLGFRPYRFNKKMEADSLRVSQLGQLKYFNGNLIDLSKGGSLDFIKNENKTFLEKSILDILNKQKKYSSKIEELKYNELMYLDSSDYIEKYFSIFYNDRKKVVYYKNNVLKLLIKLLKENKENKNTIDNILSNLDSIKNLNKDEYDSMTNIIKEIFYLLSSDLSNGSNIVQNNYDLLISRVFNLNDTRKIKLIKDVDRYNYLGDFTKYLNLSILDIEHKDISLLDKEYYILFKQNLLVSNFSNLDIKQKYYNILLKGFISYSNNIESNLTVEEKDEFLVNTIYNIDLLEKISKSLLYRYFKNERNNQDLLVLKDKESLPDIDKIKKSIDIIFKKYSKTEKYFNENLLKYGTYIEKYKVLNTQLKEYIDALENYSLYKKQYSKVNKVLAGVEVYKDDEDTLSQEKCTKYISNFSGIELNSIKCEPEKYYYKISNISISGKQFSFDLYPYIGNTIKNIDYKNDLAYSNSREKGFYQFLESTSYSLDNEKDQYEKLFKKAKKEEKDQYFFKNFFLNKFFLGVDKKYEEFDKKNDKINEDDEIIQTFKRAKLLGTKGEFRNISDFLDIKYSNLDVKRETGDKFLIKIVNSGLSLTVKENKKYIKYGTIFNSDYKIDENNHYFYNIKLKPYIINRNGDREYIFDNTDFKIIGKIKITDFKEKIKEIFDNISAIKSEYLQKRKQGEGTQIIYNLIIGKYYIKK